MVKVTGRPKGKNHAAAHFDYIGRKGDVPLETRDGDILTDKEARAELARDWGDPVYWRDNSTVAAVSMVFRSEEHTSELQSLMRISYAVFCLKKQNKTQYK